MVEKSKISVGLITLVRLEISESSRRLTVARACQVLRLTRKRYDCHAPNVLLSENYLWLIMLEYWPLGASLSVVSKGAKDVRFFAKARFLLYAIAF